MSTSCHLACLCALTGAGPWANCHPGSHIDDVGFWLVNSGPDNPGKKWRIGKSLLISRNNIKWLWSLACSLSLMQFVTFLFKRFSICTITFSLMRRLRESVYQKHWPCRYMCPIPSLIKEIFVEENLWQLLTWRYLISDSFVQKFMSHQISLLGVESCMNVCVSDWWTWA